MSAAIAPSARAIAFAALVALFLGFVLPDTRPSAVTLLVLAGALTAAILPHELGHAAAARLFRLPVRRIALGFGPRLGGVAFGSAMLELRLVPAGGFADIAGLEGAPRAARLVIALAGPVVNLFLSPLLLVAAAFAAGAPDLGTAVRTAGEIAALLLGGTVDLAAAYVANPADLAALPIGGLPSTALAVSGSIAGGAPMLLVLISALSLAVGAVNLLPWPPLDGAIALSAITGRLLGRLSFIAVDVLLGLVLVVNLVDVARVTGIIGGR